MKHFDEQENDSPDSDSEFKKDVQRMGVALSSGETVSRFGGANAEFLKGYRGLDNETGQELTKGLVGISQHAIHPEYKDLNIKQQAGFSAEVVATSRDNAESIIRAYLKNDF